jgi:phosphotransferase system enzyme I (PtsP)
MEVESQLETTAGEVTETTATADGQRVRLLANVNLLSDLPLARQVKAEGIGLYRSEFPFLVRSTLPSEEEQLVIYSQLVRESPSPLVTFRTLDLGGDKLLAYYDSSGEENPQMGLRSIRFSFRHRDVFEQQLRAILRAAEGIDLRIMFPMISSVEDFLKARDITRRCIEDLREEGVDCHRSPEIGMMVEVPSAVALIDVLAEEADFLCIGTNDLTQFLLAVDRTNEKVAEYYTSCHPAVLRALKRVTEVCIAAGKHVSVCGEMAHERDFLPFLLGIGIRSLSVDPQFLPEIQQSIAALSVEQCRLHAEAVLAERTVMGIARRMHLHHPQSSSDQVTAE